ncbi:MAG TPA: hypothetical protein VFH51_15050 [Myxococcota bacterium]|nr:hypothetical protein [Myxococcota bacterium]
MYAAVEDVRAEGVTEDEASDARVVAALLEATEAIDRACGWFFEPRELGFALSGRGSAVLELPVPLLKLMTARVGADDCVPEEFTAYEATVGTGGRIPKLVRQHGAFPRGIDNVWLYGRWGYTVPTEGFPEGKAPWAIRRATLLLALRHLPQLASDESVAARSHWRLVEERTRDQSYRLEARGAGALTGDPDVDSLLLPYRRPCGLGAA